MRIWLLLLLTLSSSFAVLPGTTVWEFRPGATAGNVNGGGFDSTLGGTNYTLQDAAQLTQTDGTAAGTANFASVLGGFTSIMVGNLLHITASTGLTVGWYEIVAFVDANNVTLDRTPGTGSATTFFVGGALSLNSSGTDDSVFETFVGGNIVWFRAGAYTLGGAIAVASTSGTVTSNIFVYGYNTTRDDKPTGSNRPTIACAALGFSLGSSCMTVAHIGFTSTAVASFTAGASCRLENCKIQNSSTSAGRTALSCTGAGNRVVNCEIICQNGSAIVAAGTSLFHGNYIHDSTTGFSSTSSGNTFTFNLFENCRTEAISFSATDVRGMVINNTFYGAEAVPVGIGVRTTGATGSTISMRNNIFYGLSVGIEIATVLQDSIVEDYNCFNNCTTPRTRIATGPHSVTTNPAFTAATQITGSTATTSGQVLTQSGGDFSTVTDGDYVRVVIGTGVTTGIYLIASHTGTTLTTALNSFGTSSAGDVVYVVYTGHNFLPTATLAGFPGAFNGAETTGFLTIGAAQKASAAGGEHSSVFSGP